MPKMLFTTNENVSRNSKSDSVTNDTNVKLSLVGRSKKSNRSSMTLIVKLRAPRMKQEDFVRVLHLVKLRLPNGNRDLWSLKVI